MKLIIAVGLILLSLIFCRAQNSDSTQTAPDEKYTNEMVRLLTGLQRNPWLGWESGTQFVIRYFVDTDAAGIPRGHAQPDLVYQVVEPDKRFVVIYTVKGKTTRRDFLVKDQSGLDAPWPKLMDSALSKSDMDIDGFTLSCLVSELSIQEWGLGRRVNKQWLWAGHPSIVLRKEVIGGEGWKLTSARVIKKIGFREFPCVEIKKWMRSYYQGPNDVITTQYLSPDVPGHLVEEIQEFFEVKNQQRSSTPFQIVHTKVAELTLPKPRHP